jgi:hypothetical protein
MEEGRKTPKKQDAQFIYRDSERKPLKRKTKSSPVGPSRSVMLLCTRHSMVLVFGNHKRGDVGTKASLWAPYVLIWSHEEHMLIV